MSLYERHGAIYDSVMNVFASRTEERLKQQAIARLDLRPGECVLDWGCGTGRNLRLIEAQLKRGRIYAVDQSPHMLKRAITRVSTRTALDHMFILGSGLSIELPEKVDAAVACLSLGCLGPDQIERGVQTIWNNLKPGGRVAIIDDKFHEPRTSYESVHQAAYKKIVGLLFNGSCSEVLVPTVERFFMQTDARPVELERTSSVKLIAFVGRRREEISRTHPISALHARATG